MIEFITHFSVLLVFFNILLIFFIFYSFLSKTFNVFQFQRPNCSCFNGIKVVVPLRVEGGSGGWGVGWGGWDYPFILAVSKVS